MWPTLQDMKVNATKHVVPHDNVQTAVMRMNVIKNMAYMSNEQVDRQQAVISHVRLTRLAQTHMKHLNTTYRMVNIIITIISIVIIIW